MTITHHTGRSSGIPHQYVLLRDGRDRLRLSLPPDANPKSPRHALHLAAERRVGYLQVLASLGLARPEFIARQLALYHQLATLAAQPLPA